MHNKEFLEVTELEQSDEIHDSFYDPSDTENFLTVERKDNKHQLFICAKTRELILFVPSKQHQNDILIPKQNHALRSFLEKSLAIKKDNSKKTGRKKRRLMAEKWIFWGRGVIKN